MAAGALFNGGGAWLSFAVAAYGAIVATAVAVYQFVRDRPGVRLLMFPTHVSFDDGSPSVDLWTVRIVNHRKQPITIRDGGLLGTRGEHIHTPILDDDGARAHPFPRTLTEGMSFEFNAPLDFERERDRDYAGAWVVDDLKRTYEAHEPPRDPWRRWRQYRARRSFEKLISTSASSPAERGADRPGRGAR